MAGDRRLATPRETLLKEENSGGRKKEEETSNTKQGRLPSQPVSHHRPNSEDNSRGLGLECNFGDHEEGDGVHAEEEGEEDEPVPSFGEGHVDLEDVGGDDLAGYVALAEEVGEADVGALVSDGDVAGVEVAVLEFVGDEESEHVAIPGEEPEGVGDFLGILGEEALLEEEAREDDGADVDGEEGRHGADGRGEDRAEAEAELLGDAAQHREGPQKVAEVTEEADHVVDHDGVEGHGDEVDYRSGGGPRREVLGELPDAVPGFPPEGRPFQGHKQDHHDAGDEAVHQEAQKEDRQLQVHSSLRILLLEEHEAVHEGRHHRGLHLEGALEPEGLHQRPLEEDPKRHDLRRLPQGRRRAALRDDVLAAGEGFVPREAGLFGGAEVAVFRLQLLPRLQRRVHLRGAVDRAVRGIPHEERRLFVFLVVSGGGGEERPFHGFAVDVAGLGDRAPEGDAAGGEHREAIEAEEGLDGGLVDRRGDVRLGLPREVPKSLDDLKGDARIEPRRRLVDEDHRRRVDEFHGDAQPLPLPPREPARGEVATLVQFKGRYQNLHPSFLRPPQPRGVVEGLEHRQRRQHDVVLGRDGAPATEVGRPLHLDAVRVDGSFCHRQVRRLNPRGAHVEQRRLPRAARTHHRRHLTRGEVRVDAVEQLRAPVLL
mmetsp:Transcript_36661/g.117600  ORF Transcript_36661/g.117600 Transcript_36661/m.117600 type:complete len:655 (-) Transcript_36661:180-2144(-)